jgi:hypothetical protein
MAKKTTWATTQGKKEERNPNMLWVDLGLYTVEEMKRREKAKKDCEKFDKILDKLYEKNPW